MLKLSILIAICLSFSHVADAKKDGAGCDRKRVDKCAEKLFMIGDYGFKFPDTLPLMNVRCREIKALEACVKDFASKCLTSDAKQAVSVLLYGVTKTNKFYCSSTKRKNTLVDATQCFIPNKKFMDDEMRTMSNKFSSIVGYKDPKLRIPLACW